MGDRVTVLGATGSVGRSTADVLVAHRDRFTVAAVVGGRDAPALAAVARRLRASFAAVADPAAGTALREALAGSGIVNGAGPTAVAEAAEREAEIVVAAICGVAGLRPTHAALKPGRRIALANKESLVCAGQAFMRDAARIGAEILPLDSEHNALAQALGCGSQRDATRLTITASGGPFRTWSRQRIAQATPAEAARHPTYSMGEKINVDSASLMNKGLEVIEAHHLFGFGPGQLDVVVHPQSIVHALVQWRDGAVSALLAKPDMRVPIAHCLGAGRRLDLPDLGLDLAAIGQLTFEKPDADRFPCLALARAALEAGGALPALLNGANEVAVAAFLAGKLSFYGIARVVEETCEILAGRYSAAPDTVEDALAVDGDARRVASERATGETVAAI